VFTGSSSCGSSGMTSLGTADFDFLFLYFGGFNSETYKLSVPLFASFRAS